MTGTNANLLADDEQQHPSTPKNRKGQSRWWWMSVSAVIIALSVMAGEWLFTRDSDNPTPLWASVVVSLMIAGLVVMSWTLVWSIQSGLSTSAVDRERDRLESAIETKTQMARAGLDALRRLSQIEKDDQVEIAIGIPTGRATGGAIGGVTVGAVGQGEVSKPSSYVQLTVPSQALRQANENEVRFSTLLLDYYAHGLVQARRSSMASLWSSVLGIIVIIIGVGIAIFRTDTGIAASITVSLAGVVTNAVGVLFHQQANRALAHMETQTTSLRQDMRDDQDGYDAIDLIGNVSDPLMRDRLLAAVVLQLTKATLPPAEEAARGGEDDTQPEPAAAAG